MKETEKRNLATKLIREGLDAYGGLKNKTKLPSFKISPRECHQKLSPEQVNEGVVAFILSLKLTAGSEYTTLTFTV